MCEIAIYVILNVKLKPFPDQSFTFHLAILLNEHSISVLLTVYDDAQIWSYKI